MRPSGEAHLPAAIDGLKRVRDDRFVEPLDSQLEGLQAVARRPRHQLERRRHRERHRRLLDQRQHVAIGPCSAVDLHASTELGGFRGRPDPTEPLAIGKLARFRGPFASQVDGRLLHALVELRQARHTERLSLLVGDPRIDGWLDDLAVLLQHDGAVELGPSGVERDLVAGFGVDATGAVDPTLVGEQRKSSHIWQVRRVARVREQHRGRPSRFGRGEGRKRRMLSDLIEQVEPLVARRVQRLLQQIVELFHVTRCRIIRRHIATLRHAQQRSDPEQGGDVRRPSAQGAAARPTRHALRSCASIRGE